VKLFLHFLSIFILVTSCAGSDDKCMPPGTDEFQERAVSLKAPCYSIETCEIHPNEFGYKILKDGKMIINQMNIPAVQGNKGFPSQESAMKTGELMLNKIKKGVFPPTISKEELDSLGVI
jgi:hypothetical protein